jgi:UDP-GlcNAc:undecaprenyl-phosphate GlcNAc-1-phosphate transferase
MLYALAATAGLVALLTNDLPLDAGLAAIAAFTLVLTIAGVYLGRVNVYKDDPARAGARAPLVSFLVDVSYKRRVFEVLLDVVLIILAYYLAYALLYGSVEINRDWDNFMRTGVVLVVVQLAAFLVMGVYRGLWRYISLDDLLVYAKAVLLGSAASLGIMFLGRLTGSSPKVFVLDGLILLLLVTGSRLSFRLGRMLLPAVPGQRPVRRVLIYGAGDAGVMLVRLLRNDRTLGCVPVGFADDDPLKSGRVVHGLRVFGGNGSFLSICQRHRVDAVYISSTRFSAERVEQISQECQKLGVELNRLRVVLEPVVLRVRPMAETQNA